jgi:2-haloacid dehalogenase
MRKQETSMSKSIIFDLGGVLIDWNPRHLYRKLFPGDEAAMERFLGEVCTMEWHLQHDAGRPFVETCAELKLMHPGHDALIDAFGDRHDEMTAGAIEGTVALLERLAANGVPLYAITNYPAETFPMARRKFPFLALFGDVAVSGVERVLKPSAELFNILLQRNNIVPGEAIFIDDAIKNVDAARALGLHAIHFRSADQLEQEMLQLGVLRAGA